MTELTGVTATKVETMRDLEREVRALIVRIRRKSLANARIIHPDLQASAYSVLLFIAENRLTRASEVAEALDLDKGAVSRQIAHLQELALVARNCDPADRRVQTLQLTASAQMRIDAMTEHRKSEIARRLDEWPAGDLADFVLKLGRFNIAFDQ